MEQYDYQTIKNKSKGLFRDRGSKFLAFAYPVYTEDEIREILDYLRREYHDARHHCYAWRLGAGKELLRANDDKEPSGTAGRPVLGQIEKHSLTNILIVVVRYFGGTLLGRGGLINAYRSAAADAIANSDIITRTVDQLLRIKFPYTAMNKVMRVLKEEQAEQLGQEFDKDCTIKVGIPRKKCEKLTGRLNMIEQVTIRKLSINY